MDAEDRAMAARRKIRTADGQIGAIMTDFGNGICSVQLHKGGYYPMMKLATLRDATEEEFKREFR